MTRYRLSWLLVTLLSGAVLAVACGDDDDDPGGTGGKAGSGGGAGSSVTGGSGGVGGTGGTAGTAGKDGGSKDAPVRTPCGETTCNPTGPNPYCNLAGPTGPRCQACMTDMHCAGNMQMPLRLFCDLEDGACRSCLTDAHCTPPNRCIIGMGNANNTCQLRCASDADCAAATNKACNLTTMMCVQCQNNTHCAGNAGGPICVGNTCEICGVDADCAGNAGGPVCDATNNTCVQCRDNTQCAEPTPICVTTGANTCRECGANADCTGRPGGGACVMNVCRQCNGAVPCPAGNTCTMNTCVPIPEAGPPEPRPEAGSDGSEGGTEGGAETGTPDVQVDLGTGG